MNIETMRLLVAKGLSAEDILEVAETMAAPVERSAAAKRQARYRARLKGGNVTETVTETVTDDVTRDAERDVTTPLSLSPNENNSNPHTHTPGNTPRARKGTGSPAKPEGVSDEVWRDFLAHRKRKRADVTATAMAGIEREARAAGWTLEAALAETVTSGWQSFKAEYVQGRAKPSAKPANDIDPLMRSLMARKQRENTG